MRETNENLSDRLYSDHTSSEFGDALKGYSERADQLENELYDMYYRHALGNGVENIQADREANAKFQAINDKFPI